MSLYLFYTMVEKCQKWRKTSIKGGGVKESKEHQSYIEQMRHGCFYVHLMW